MTTKSRRRTLSHLEVENFLNEIGSEKSVGHDVDIPKKAQGLKNISEVMKPDSSELKGPAITNHAQMIRDYCKV